MTIAINLNTYQKNSHICCYNGKILRYEQLKIRERQLDNGDSDKSYLGHLQVPGMGWTQRRRWLFGEADKQQQIKLPDENCVES